MSDKSRAYSDSAVTVIVKGNNWAEVKGQIDDMNSLAEELREVTNDCANAIAALDKREAEIAHLKNVVDDLKRQLDICKVSFEALK